MTNDEMPQYDEERFEKLVNKLWAKERARQAGKAWPNLNATHRHEIPMYSKINLLTGEVIPLHEWERGIWELDVDENGNLIEKRITE